MFILAILLYILFQGLPAISLEFIFGFPSNGMRSGGIFPAIVGTVLLTLVLRSSVSNRYQCAAIFLSEYSKDNWLTRIIRIAIISLAGIPSVVLWLVRLRSIRHWFALWNQRPCRIAYFRHYDLPVVISTSEEALRAVPQEFRVVSVSVGATQWQTIRRIVLPQAVPGILTGVILGLERAAGETAPILFTGAAFFLPRLPTSPLDATMALPIIFTSFRPRYQECQSLSSMVPR